MSGFPRRARIRALAKVNLSLKVIGKRSDGYHELRTVFQTISLSDSLDFEFTPARRSEFILRSVPEIPGNLVERAAALVLDRARIRGRLEITLTKRIPLGSGLGGGSSDAAAVLLTLPVLAGKRLSAGALNDLAEQLGSDVAFFLFGGTALGLGRGGELYPLPEQSLGYGLVVVPNLCVSTAEAYKDLKRPLLADTKGLTSIGEQNIINSFQSWIWGRDTGNPAALATAGENDFEKIVFARYPRLKAIRSQLSERLGARMAMLSGSGSSVFGVFGTRPALDRARRLFPDEQVFPVSFVNRARYRSYWRRWLGQHIAGQEWPPQSQYS